MPELPASAFQIDPERITAFVEDRMDDSAQAELADDVARLLPFHDELPHPLVADLTRLRKHLGGDEALLAWLDRWPGRPRLTARLYRVIALLDLHSGSAAVVQALSELRERDPYPHGLAGHLVPDTTTYTLASLSQEIEELLGDDRPEEARALAVQSLMLLADIAPRAAELDPGADGLASTVRNHIDALSAGALTAQPGR
ncbi:MAG: hypothetical protein QOF00_891 [Pseudonocardiales bacterium]|jgi:hypothetical protein|nr:hypothetical protein [Pseudonocardiales bacterium]